MKLYVGNLFFDMTGRKLRELFNPFGTVSEVKLITDRETGESRGFGLGSPIPRSAIIWTRSREPSLTQITKLKRQIRGNARLHF